MSARFKIAFAVWILVTSLGVLNCWFRPGLPGRLQVENGTIEWSPEVTGASSVIIQYINGVPVQNSQSIEYLLTMHRIGDEVHLSRVDGTTHTVFLIRYYSWLTIFLHAVIAILFYFLCWEIALKSMAKGAQYFVYSGFLFGFIIASGHAGLYLHPNILSWMIVFFYFFSYPLAFVNLLIFSYYFPSVTLVEHSLNARKRVILIVGFLIAITLLSLFYLRVTHPSPAFFNAYFQFYRVFRFFIFITILLFFINIITNTKRKPDPVNRKKLAWVLGGIVIGSFPFVFLWSLPQALGFPPLMPEIWTYPFLLIPPITMTIAILRYNLFDVEMFLSRSMIYGSLVSILVVFYVAVAGSTSWLVTDQFTLNTPWISVLSALFIALLFNPLRNFLQVQIDRRFFPVLYDRRRTMGEFLHSLEQAHTVDMVYRNFHKYLEKMIAVEQAAIWQKMPTGGWKDVLLQEVIPTESIKWLERCSLPEKQVLCANKKWENLLNSKQPVHFIGLPQQWLLLIPGTNREIILIGKKKGGIQYIDEELAVIFQMVQAMDLQIQKLEFLQRLVQERIEKEAAQKLSRWKSLLIAEVAHDMRSPLNSILWKLKTARSLFKDKLDNEPRVISEIENQIFRLQYLIQSLLITSDIERGKLRIQKVMLNLQDQIDECLKQIAHLIETKKIRVVQKIPPDLVLAGDPLLLQEVLLNLLENSLKYSRPNACIWIDAYQLVENHNKKVFVTVKDEAGGIPKSQMERIFKPLEVEINGKNRPKGFNLGLYIARQFMELLEGRLEIAVQPGKGTEFKLTFYHK